MSQSEYDAAVAAFITSKGITRCPTACVVPTQGTVSTADRQALQQRAADAEDRRHRRRPRAPFAMPGNNPLPRSADTVQPHPIWR